MQTDEYETRVAERFLQWSRHPILAHWLPDKHFGEDDPERIHAAALLAFVWLSGLLGAPFTYFYSVVQYRPVVLVAIVFGVAPAVIVPVLLRRIGSVRVVAHVTCLSTYIATVLATYEGRTPVRTGFIWLMLPAAYAAVFTDRRGVAIWSAAAILAVGAFGLTGSVASEVTRQELVQLEREQIFTTVGLMLIVTCLLLFQDGLAKLLVGRLARAQQELREQAIYDDLTGLPNRILFRDRLAQSVRRARRRETALVVGFFDLDDFKSVNDLYGHQTGDEVLVEIGRRFDEALRDEDTVARIGGDEFIAIFDRATGEDDVAAIAERIRDALEPPLLVGEREIHASVSMGFARFQPGALPQIEDEQVGEVLRTAADRAMYVAKTSDGTDWQLSQAESDLEPGERLERVRAIEEGAERGQFVPYYQPIVRIGDGTVVGAEVLARWEHPERGLVSPGQFLKLAEEASLLHEVQKSVVGNLRTDFGESSKCEGTSFDLFLNLDPVQLGDSAAFQELHEMLQHDDISHLEFAVEITETDLLGDDSVSERLRSHGYKLAVDDFGTGYSSLNRFTEVAVDCLKIDMQFVQRFDSPTYRSIVENIADLGRRFGIPVIGEGVERPEHLEFLASVSGCNYGQGYHLGEPAPFDQLRVETDGASEPALRVFG